MPQQTLIICRVTRPDDHMFTCTAKMGYCPELLIPAVSSERAYGPSFQRAVIMSWPMPASACTHSTPAPINVYKVSIVCMPYQK